MSKAPRRVFVAVSRFNEAVTRRLLEGARAALAGRGVGDKAMDVVWVPGAFELPVAVHRALGTGRYRFAVALGAIVRGETPHFDILAAETARALGEVALRHGLPVGLGVLTTDTLEQAVARAGGAAGNKGADAALAALETAEGIERLTGDAAS